MKNIIRSLQLSVILFPSLLCAQQDPMISQYMFSGHFVNPGYAGTHDYANVTLLGRKQWVGMDGAPFTSYLSFDTPVTSKNIGWGAIVSNDHIGVTDRTELSGTFSYHLKINKNAKLSFGFREGLTYYRANVSKLKVWDKEDVLFNTDVNSKLLPVSGAGIYFYTERFYAGLSIPNIISYKPETFLHAGINDAPQLQRHYFGMIGYAIPAGENLDIKPSVLVKYAANAPVEFDYNLDFFFYKTIWIGAAYRSGDGIIGMAEYQATRNLRVGYSYDMTLSNLNTYNSGSHEIMVAWDFVQEQVIRYKSPRFF